MSSFALSNVAVVPDVLLPAGNFPTGNDPVTLFTIPGTAPARIESVYLSIPYDGADTYGDVFVLRLVDPAPAVLWAQVAPQAPDTNVQTLELTWVRRGNDTAQGGMYVFPWDDGENESAWWTGELPDLVLRPSSIVQLQALRGSIDPDVPDLTLTNIAVTYSTGAGGTVTTTMVQPYLIPLNTEVTQ